MKNKLCVLLFTLIFPLALFAQLEVKILDPVPLAIVGDFNKNTILVSAQIITPYDITSVTATLEDLDTSLGYRSGAGSNVLIYKGFFVLSTLHEGDTLHLTVTAINIHGDKGTTSENIIYNKPPLIQLAQPIDSAIADPNIHFNVRSIDIDSCTLNIYASDFSGTKLVYSGFIKDSLQGDLDLFEDRNQPTATLQFDIIDRYQRLVSAKTNIQVMSSPLYSRFLSKCYTGNKRVLDFRDSMVLVADNPFFDSSLAFKDITHLAIINLRTKIETSIPLNTKTINSKFSRVTAYGAIIATTDTLYDWNSGVLYAVTNNFKHLRSNGGYAVWTDTNHPYLYFRDLSRHETKKIANNVFYATDDAFTNHSIAENGKVVYGATNKEIMSYENGITTRLTNDNGKYNNFYPVTDGKYTVYSKQHVGVFLNDGNTESIISTYKQIDGTNVDLYAVNNKYVAHISQTNPQFYNSWELWVRDSTGKNTQLTNFQHEVSVYHIDKVDALGRIVFKFRYSGLLMTTTYKNDPFDYLSISTFGRSYCKDSSWYVIFPNAVYKVNPRVVVNVGEGNWSDPSIWEGKIVPDENDAVILTGKVTVDINAKCKSLKVLADKYNGSLHVNPNVTLTIVGK